MDQYRESSIGCQRVKEYRTYDAHHYEYRDLHELILIRQTLVSLMPCLEMRCSSAYWAQDFP